MISGLSRSPRFLVLLGLLTNFTSVQAAVVNFTGAFAPSNWTSTPAGDSSLSHSSTTLTLVGPNNGGGDNTARVSLTLAQGGDVQFHYSGSTADTDGWEYDSLGYDVNGSSTQLSPNSGYSSVSGTINLTLNPGDTLRFYVNSVDSGAGAATLTIDTFSFTAVPEPAEISALAAAGLLGFVAWRRLQRQG